MRWFELSDLFHNLYICMLWCHCQGSRLRIQNAAAIWLIVDSIWCSFLWPTTAAFTLLLGFATGATDCNVRVLTCKLHILKVKLSNDILNRHTSDSACLCVMKWAKNTVSETHLPMCLLLSVLVPFLWTSSQCYHWSLRSLACGIWLRPSLPMHQRLTF